MKFETMIILGMLLFIVVNVAVAKAKFNEFHYTKIWCEANNGNYGGKNGVRMSDGTLADCITKDYAIEFDFCRKWYECGTQAANYANLLNKKPMCILICNPKNQQRYINRYNNALKYINRHEKPKLIVIPE